VNPSFFNNNQRDWQNIVFCCMRLGCVACWLGLVALSELKP